MFEVISIFLISVFIIGICLHNHSLNNMVNNISKKVVLQVRRSAESSIMASNTVNPIISLVEVVKSVEKIESLHQRYGPYETDKITKVNTTELLNVLLQQKDRILQDVMKVNKKYKPEKHPLLKHAGY